MLRPLALCVQIKVDLWWPPSQSTYVCEGLSPCCEGIDRFKGIRARCTTSRSPVTSRELFSVLRPLSLRLSVDFLRTCLQSSRRREELECPSTRPNPCFSFRAAPPRPGRVTPAWPAAVYSTWERAHDGVCSYTFSVARRLERGCCLCYPKYVYFESRSWQISIGVSECLGECRFGTRQHWHCRTGNHRFGVGFRTICDSAQASGGASCANIACYF